MAFRILTVLIFILCAGAIAADTGKRPLAREDQAAQALIEEQARLASFRAQARPVHMIRYPVQIETDPPILRPQRRPSFLPLARWGSGPRKSIWTRAAMSAIEGHTNLAETLPRDIDAWCPAYRDNPPDQRRAFWVGLMSALAKHESTYRPRAVGGGNRWFGLLQISPATARGYGCRAGTGSALLVAAENLSCAARIMNTTVRRDQAIAVYEGRWRGVAADWGPMSNRAKIADMSAWTRAQSYCVPLRELRPVARP